MLENLRLVAIQLAGAEILTFVLLASDFSLYQPQIIFGNTEEKSEKGPSLFNQAAGIFSSLNRFMRAISK